MQPLKLQINSDGAITAIYSDELSELIALGDAQITRASHVEPSGSQWIADMGPVGGPVLGPFVLRSQALTAEVAYLDNLLFQ